MTEARIPLAPDGSVDVGETVALALKIRGTRGQEVVRFGLAGPDERQRVMLGEIFQFLPLGISTDWQQMVIEIPAGTHTVLPRATALTLGFNHQEGEAVFLKEVKPIARIPGTEGWQTLAASLSAYSLDSLDEITGLVLDRFEGRGTRIQEIQTGEAETAPRRIRHRSGTKRQSQVPALGNGYYRVADFDSGLPTRLRGRYGAYARAPSSASLDLVAQVRPAAGGKSLRLEYDQKKEGFCGLWVDLLEERDGVTTYFDATPFEVLSFWVREEGGQTGVTLQAADERWSQKGDSVALGALSDFPASATAGDWREVTVPLKRMRDAGLDLSRLASLSLNVTGAGAASLYLDDIAFKAAREVHVPPSPTGIERQTSQRHRRATWLWDPTPAFESPAEWTALFEFVRREGIDIFFVQTHCLYDQVDGQAGCRLDQEESFRKLAREAHREGIEIHALDGYSYHVLPRWRPLVLAQVQAVLDYNARVDPLERFDGIHHDNEPYLLPDYAGALKEELLLLFLDLTFACQQLIDQSGQRLSYGVDIPFWYDTIEVNWRGERKAMSQHTIDIVDAVGLMAYRTDAYGPNGVLSLAYEEVEYASRQGKEAFVALETTPLPDQVSYRFVRGPLDSSSPGDRREPVAYLLIEEWDGVAILYWKELAEGESGRALAANLGELLAGGGRRRLLLSVDQETVPGSQLSFAQSTADRLRRVAEAVVDELGDKKGFSGIAIHDYEGYRRLAGQH